MPRARARHDPDTSDAPDLDPADGPDEDSGLDDGRPSKSALKRQMHGLQALGLALAELPPSRVAKLALPESLSDAVAQYRRTRSHEGRRRQLQFIGKLMRKVDAEPIQAAVDAFRLGGAQETLALHEAERWREEMLAGDEAVTRWLTQRPDTDTQRLRALLRSARKDASTPQAPGQEARHGRAYRELFQLVKSALSAPAPGSAAADAATDDIESSDDE